MSDSIRPLSEQPLYNLIQITQSVQRSPSKGIVFVNNNREYLAADVINAIYEKVRIGGDIWQDKQLPQELNVAALLGIKGRITQAQLGEGLSRWERLISTISGVAAWISARIGLSKQNTMDTQLKEIERIVSQEGKP